jgi:hypothetical protein
MIDTRENLKLLFQEAKNKMHFNTGKDFRKYRISKNSGNFSSYF